MMPPDRWGEELVGRRTRRAEDAIALCDTRAGFEPLRAGALSGIYQITGIARLTGRSKSTGDATYTARLKTSAGNG